MGKTLTSVILCFLILCVMASCRTRTSNSPASAPGSVTAPTLSASVSALRGKNHDGSNRVLFTLRFEGARAPRLRAQPTFEVLDDAGQRVYSGTLEFG